MMRYARKYRSYSPSIPRQTASRCRIYDNFSDESMHCGK